MTTFADIAAAAGSLSGDEQQSLIAILQRRMVDENRKRLRSEIDDARAEHASGASRPTSAVDLIEELRRDS